MLKISTPLSLITASLILLGCGGVSTDSGASAISNVSTSNSEDTSPQNLPQSTVEMSKITGSVPGTLIEVFCSDGSYYSTESEQNGSTQHPFSLEIPKNLACHLVMTTNENDPTTRVITPITLEGTEGNGSAFILTDDQLDLGYVDLAMSPAQIIDANGDQVVDQPLHIKPKQGTIASTSIEEDPLDKNQNGMIDLFEDDDEDGIYNREDHDRNRTNDLDGDGINNQQDHDDDNDGIKDELDRDDNNNGIDDEEEENRESLPPQEFSETTESNPNDIHEQEREEDIKAPQEQEIEEEEIKETQEEDEDREEPTQEEESKEDDE